MNFTDGVKVSRVRRTADGYLVAEARAVREGVQVYSGVEVGMTDRALVNIYRPRAEVFAKDSLQSFSHAPITIDHPVEAVTAANWKDLAVGEVSTAAMPDGEWVMLPLILKDAKAIAAVEAGKCELSAGYVCELDWTPGTTADGQSFDAQQRNIKINHLALVDRARAGSSARIGDGAGSWGVSPIVRSNHKEDTMSDALKTVVLGDKAAQVALADAPIIEAFKAESAKRFADAQSAHDSAMAAKDAALAKAEAERDAAKASVLSDAALDGLVAARATLIADAKAIAPDMDAAGKSDAAIRRGAVLARLGDAALAGKSDAYVDARFDILLEDAKTDPVRAAVRGPGVVAFVGNDADKAYGEMTAGLTAAWNKKGGV